jgi:hypothetical protein
MEMTQWNIIEKYGHLYVENLKSDPAFGMLDPYPDLLLLVRYPEGDCNTLTEDGENLHSALYNEYQCNSNLNDGDEFLIDGQVKYRCEGLHVVPAD